ncbi:hypothetical protein MKW94_014040, partial [Papaver nudicaule]|nr:hypothetical protein [Papaver nudicaule]
EQWRSSAPSKRKERSNAEDEDGGGEKRKRKGGKKRKHEKKARYDDMDDTEADMGGDHEEYANVNTRDSMNRMMDDEDDNGAYAAQELAAAGLEDSDVEEEA